MGGLEDPSAAGPRRSGAFAAARRYATAVAVVGLAFGLKLGFPEYFGPPYILFYPAIMVVALVGGLGPGLLATVLASVLALRWVLPAESPGQPLGLRGLVSLLVFAAMGLLMSAVAEHYRRTRARLAQAEFQRALQDSGAASLEAVRQAAEEARQAARRQAYLVSLSDALRPLADSAEIQRQASRLLGEQLRASRVHYAEVVEDGQACLVNSDYTDGLPSVAGRHRFDDHGPAVMNEFRAGRTLVVHDVATDPRLKPEERASTLTLAVAAYVVRPLFKAGRPVAVLVVHQSTPRAWAPLELEVIAETAERTWAAVERAQAEQALRRSEEGLRAAQSVAHVGSWAWHVQTGRLQWSDEMYRIFGIDQASFTGDLAEVVGRAIHPDDRAAVEASNEAVLRQGRPTPLEYRILHADGAVRTVWAEAGALQRDGAGRPELLTGIVLDITERRGAELERARLESQLQQARKMESIGRLAGGIAHDFNNMLGVILGHADLALEQAGVAGLLRSDLEEIQAAARRSAELTRQLLAYARKQTISPAVLDLNATMAAMLKMLQRLLGEQIHLAWRPGAGLWPVRLDPSQIDQILANLCVNARDAIAEAGRLTIETSNVTLDEADCRTRAEATPGDWVRLTVSDDGCGMDQETQARLFEPFFTTKPQGQGTGLGLATTYGIVKQNGGFITVSSELGVGTAFAIHLPRHQGAAAATLVEARRPVRGHETVLLVEDEPAILGVACRMLEGQGYQVLAAATPGEGLRLADGHPGRIDLLLTDVVMPEMNGRELARSLGERHPGAKRLYMSGYTADVIAHQGVLAEGVQFIQKPFTNEALAAAVRTALDAAV